MFKATGTFDKNLEKATSHLLLETDWDAILQICDTIRQGDVSAKYALQQIRKKIFNQNPHVSLFALLTLESVVKNCGSLIHEEVATKQFMEDLKDLAKVSEEKRQEKVLELIQVWSHAFRNDSKYRVIQDTYNLMKMEGYKFPELKESDAMFAAETAPKWENSETCHRCRTEFGVVTRKHHCRHCGQVFCGKCSSKQATIPKFGIEKEVRVCEACFEKLKSSGGETTASTSAIKDPITGLPKEYLNSPLSKEAQQPAAKDDLKEEEELQLAIALSQSEAEEKEKQKKKLTNMYSEQQRAVAAPPQHVINTSAPPLDPLDEVSPELAKYLNRSYWEQKQSQQQTPSSPRAKQNVAATNGPTSSSLKTTSISPVTVQEKFQNGEMGDMEEFMSALRSSVEIFENRMKSNSARGRHLAYDSSVQTLFMNLTALHPQLLKYMNDMDESRAHYELLQDKISQVKDAREALDALREEHEEKLRREAEERQRQRQMQMMMKLEDMRKKKHEYLEYQRQLALQRMQEQERELQMRKQQQYQPYYPQPNIHQYPAQGYSGPGGSIMAYSTDGSPMHQHHFPPTSQPGYGAVPPVPPEYYAATNTMYQQQGPPATHYMQQPATIQYSQPSNTYMAQSQQPPEYSPYNGQGHPPAGSLSHDQQQVTAGYDTSGQQMPQHPPQPYDPQQQFQQQQQQQQTANDSSEQQPQTQQPPNPQLISFD